jgi:hypothetical protein
MPDADFPRDKHPEFSSEEDAKQRGATQKGGDDRNVKNPHVELPPFDSNFRPLDLGAKIESRLREDKPRRRTQTLFPYLFTRAVPGDRGARPGPLWPPTVCWESCDIHLMPAGAGAFDFTKTVLQPVAGQSYRVFVHVWNLGRFAAYGARLRAWWVEPGFFNGTTDPRYQPHFIGGAYFDLGDRDSAQSHRLIEVTTPWKVVMNNDAHECLITAVECATDPWDGVMDANTHRHVAQRNVNLVEGSASIVTVVGRLGSLMSKGDTLLLITHSSVGRTNFVGAHERGVSVSSEAAAGWNHSGLAFGNENRPIAAVRPGRDRMQYFDLGHLGQLPLPRSGLGKGIPVTHGLERELPILLGKTLRMDDPSGASAAAALGGLGAASVIRFVTTDSAGKSMGYSVVVAP